MYSKSMTRRSREEEVAGHAGRGDTSISISIKVDVDISLYHSAVAIYTMLARLMGWAVMRVEDAIRLCWE